MIKRFKEYAAENSVFWIICGSLMLGIALACGVWFFIRPHSTFTDADARKIRYENADEYQRVAAWQHELITHRHQRKVCLADVTNAVDLLKTVKSTARGNIVQALCMDGSGSNFEKEITQVVVPYCADPNPHVRYALALDLRDLSTPQAKAAYERMKDDPDPEVRNEVRGQLGIANAKK